MVKLAMIIDGGLPQVFTFNTKMAARVFERMVQEEMGDLVLTKMIFDKEE